MNWADLDPQTKQIYLDQAGGDESAAAALYANYLNGGAGAGVPNGTAMPNTPPPVSAPPVVGAAAAPAVADPMASGGAYEDYERSRSQGPTQMEAAPAPVAVPPVSAPPVIGGGTGGSSSYTSGGGSGGSYQASPTPSPQMGGGQSDWSAALHASGALQNPRANPIPFDQAPGANTGMFDPYLRNTQGQAGAPPEAGGGVPPVSAPPMPGMGVSQAPQMTNFDPSAPKLGAPAPVAQGNTFGSPVVPSPAPVAAPLAAPQMGQMTPEEIRLRFGQMNRGMEQAYGTF